MVDAISAALAITLIVLMALNGCILIPRVILWRDPFDIACLVFWALSAPLVYSMTRIMLTS